MGQPISVLHSASSGVSPAPRRPLARTVAASSPRARCVAREKSPTVSPAAIKPLSTLPQPESQPRDRLFDPPAKGAPRVESSAPPKPAKEPDMTHTAALAPVLAEHIAAVNAFDEAAIVATFADHALVNDAHREFWGTEAIRRWAARELVGDRVTV